MAKKTQLMISIIIVVLILFTIYLKKDDDLSKDTTWKIHETPEEAGWSSDKLAAAKKYYDGLGSTSALVIYDGKILVSWGDVTKKSNIHSVRKSILSALYGIHQEQIHLEDSLEDLKISEGWLLMDIEKSAKIKDLLTSRSGVFLQSGEESLKMKWKRPKRGIYNPGTHFYYNNWDFNTLGTIFNQKTGSDIFVEFQNKIALPIGMEDYELQDSFYKFEKRRSNHPSYLFRMSARDMARFGQLYLQNGKWKGKQIIPEDWIQESTAVHASVSSIYGYGYMWWVAEHGYWNELGLFSAIGRYGQSIDVIPEKNVVFVHRVNSDRFFTRNLYFDQVSNHERLKLLTLILEAKIE